ncbi:MAG: GTPase [Patescibacteria group bacterium]
MLLINFNHLIFTAKAWYNTDMMTDLVGLYLAGGAGGNGRVSFRREYRVAKGGPDGGDGGNGGSIIIRAVDSLTTLKHFAGKKKFEAEHGRDGGKKNMTGAKGEDLVLEVPVGTIIWQVTENESGHIRRLRGAGLSQRTQAKQVRLTKYWVEKEGQPLQEQQVSRPDDELLDPEKVDEVRVQNRFEPQEQGMSAIWEAQKVGDQVTLCQGGFGGKGNDFFKSSTQTTPMFAEFGSNGEARFVFFELKLLADIGFVGLPNAGKSTLLSRLTSARPKVADYPFTTREPHIGIWRDEQTKQELVLADIPGLIEGASEGKGLGYQFLRHIEHSKALLFVLSVSESDLYAELPAEQIAEHVWQQFQQLSHELNEYDTTLLDRKDTYLVLNKTDLYSAEQVAAIKKRFVDHQSQLLTISAATGEGIDELQLVLRKLAS